MKKLIIIFFMIAISTTYSQIIQSYGIKVGATISRQEWSAIMPGGAPKQDRLGMNIGAFAEFFNSPIFSLITEINYVQKGFKSTYLQIDEDYEGSDSWNLRIDYLNISLLAKAKIDVGDVRLYLFAGPRIDFELNKSSSISNNVYYDFEKSLVGLKFGIGSEFEISPIHLLAELVYDHNFGDLDKRSNVEVKANSIDFRIGVAL